MKKIINGRKYDTETATKLATDSGGYNCGDFRYWCEVLYKKKTGEYFLHGDGGPMSKYAKPYGNGMSGGEELKPLTQDQVKVWLERSDNIDIYESLFGECPE